MPTAAQSAPEGDFAAELSSMMVIDHAELRKGLTPHLYPPPRPDAQTRLQTLTARVRHDMAILNYPKDAWTLPKKHPDGHHVYDVIIVGGGQCGLTVGFGLMKERITNFLILDRSPKGREGPWITYSRMWTLRSPKHVTGPDLGVPSLAPRSWFEAVFGEEGWAALDKWPRQAWQAYLNWYREALDLPVYNDARVDGFEKDGDIVRVMVNETTAYYARKVVIATGIEGMGDWYVPPFVREKLPKSAWTMCTDDVDSLDWKGQRIAIIGAGATAWDRAADLLELGAKSVTIFMRRKQILVSNAFRYLEKAGYLRHYASQSDADKWRWIQTIFTFGQPPTQDGVDRCAVFDNFVVHAGATWSDAEMVADGVRVTASDGSVETFDHLFIGTGFSVDAKNRRELAPFADNITKWSDVFTPPADQPNDWLISYPYLTRDLRFVEKVPGKTPVLNDIYCFNYGATVTNAHSGASLSGIRYGIEPMLHGITYALWKECEDEHYQITKDWKDVDTDPTALERHRWQPK